MSSERACFASRPPYQTLLFFRYDVYIIKRTQLYLDEDIWKALHIQSRQRRTSISELVRQAVQDRYGTSTANRSRAMEAFVGIWSDRDACPIRGHTSGDSDPW